MTEQKHTPGIDIHGEYVNNSPCDTPVQNVAGAEKLKADHIACLVPQVQCDNGEKTIQPKHALRNSAGLCVELDESRDIQQSASESGEQTIPNRPSEHGIAESFGLLGATLPKTNCVKSGESQKVFVSTAENMSQNQDLTLKTQGDSIISFPAQKADYMKQSISSSVAANAMQRKATPGPWHVQPDPEHLDKLDKWAAHRYRFITCGNPDMTSDEWAHDSGSYIIASLRDCQNQEANAQLIAAAPELLQDNKRLKEINAELLEALKGILRHATKVNALGHEHCVDLPAFNAEQIKSLCRTAIVKATERKGVQS